MQHRIRVRLVPGMDASFRAAFEQACLAALTAGIDLDSAEAAQLAREQLRSIGYPRARIWTFRSVEEYRNRISNWLVWRDGQTQERRTRNDRQATVMHHTALAAGAER